MARRVPEGPPPPPVVQRIRLRYAKRGRLRFSSHRDFARAFERALRRAEVPMAYSAGFSPHPKISYVGAAPTGVASEAEYLEIGLARAVDPAVLRAELDRVLPPGLDVDEAVLAGPGSLAERMVASSWRIELPGVDEVTARAALARFLDRDEVGVERLTKSGRRTLDVRSPVVSAAVLGAAEAPSGESRAILGLVVRQVTPTVRPDDVVAALRDVAGLAPTGPPVAVRLAQGPLDDDGAVGDPLAADRNQATTPP
ncbi:radical SAM-linked protein [Jatrophihabitans endophyticus]|uniref:Radical SAM-linked protein n=1 Tax=Jatrophihabitans endophyticus TaxID=1206085 RepID=A0A1M5K4Z7_9ACTN|nr:TIGR03936 family radical SAM-associated protein [Jatrophihabitans endophyticus]SHG47313.1 radical SAM-linked protein [Jatrophihabitans endophyticus]